MFIGRRDSATPLCSEERHSFDLGGIAVPLYLTEPEEGGLLAINIALLRSESPDIVLFRSDFCYSL